MNKQTQLNQIELIKADLTAISQVAELRQYALEAFQIVETMRSVISNSVQIPDSNTICYCGKLDNAAHGKYTDDCIPF